ncbi:hypothetical protein ACSXDF_05940 [Clostridium perfringens]
MEYFYTESSVLIYKYFSFIQLIFIVYAFFFLDEISTMLST